MIDWYENVFKICIPQHSTYSSTLFIKHCVKYAIGETHHCQTYTRVFRIFFHRRCLFDSKSVFVIYNDSFFLFLPNGNRPILPLSRQLVISFGTDNLPGLIFQS